VPVAPPIGCELVPERTGRTAVAVVYHGQLPAAACRSQVSASTRHLSRGEHPWMSPTTASASSATPQAWRSYVTLPAVPYGATGGFALNIWIKLAPGALEGGGNYSYVLAHSGDGDEEFGVGPNHVSAGRRYFSMAVPDDAVLLPGWPSHACALLCSTGCWWH
jgi:hypothetical protein